MQLENELRLSFYRELAQVDERHGVKLVQHVENGRIFVLKALKIYDIRVFQHLAAHPMPGVPCIQELIEEDGTLYVVEEYISGISLRDRLEEGGSMEEGEAMEIVWQLCDILRPLHSLNPPIVHRDIKPDNLILTPNDKLVLVDFNSAKESDERQVRDTVLIGTAGYAAPEQYGFSPSRPTADIYAIGVLWNQLLTGSISNRATHQGSWAPVIKTCLQMDPDRRYQSVDELLRATAVQGGTVRALWDGVRSWLPPGLRSKNPWVAVSSLLWYVFVVAISASLEVEGASVGELRLNRIAFFLLFLAETAWVWNYRNVWARVPLANSKNKWMRLVGVAGWGIFLVFAVVFVLVLLTALMYH